MQVFVGTSGYAFPEWKGSFYPDDLPDDEQLAHYASRFPAVEINNTFYRVPKREVVKGWADRVPDSFRFSLKATRRITHQQRLKATEDAERSVHFFHRASLELGERLGAILFQLPPTLPKDTRLLERFLPLLPEGWPVAIEFRHASWFDEETYAMLRSRGVALCASDSDKRDMDPLVHTAPLGYLRLQREDYADDDLSEWSRRIGDQGWEEVYLFFKHEDSAPDLPQRFLDLSER